MDLIDIKPGVVFRKAEDDGERYLRLHCRNLALDIVDMNSFEIVSALRHIDLSRSELVVVCTMRSKRSA